jgi:1-acyl-sn-glycerol-3-phosphate acyltransferase
LSNTSAALPPADAPVVVALNHPAWWDPLIGIVLSRAFGEAREHFAAIDAAAVRKYPFFTRLGFFGVDPDTVRGAVEFLRVGRAILSGANRVLWVTAQGRFTDVRVRPLALRSGVGHLAARIDTGYVLPVALEYTFWTERTPEALIRIGEPLVIAESPGRSGREWTAVIETALTNTLDVLSREAAARDPGLFTPLVRGKSGVGGFYDRWRRAMAWARGERFDPSHAPSPERVIRP